MKMKNVFDSSSMFAMFVAFIVVAGSVMPFVAHADKSFNDYSVWGEPLYYDDYSTYSEPLYYDDYSTWSEPLYYDNYSTWSEPLYYDDYSVYSEPLYYDDYSVYSQPLSYDYGCGSYCGGSSWYTPSYSIGCGSWCNTGYSTPRYSAPSSSYSNVVTNTNTNVNNITNIDNSINDSFNNYNSGNTSIVVTAPVQPTTPIYTQPAPYCTITHAQYGGYGSGAYLSWTSTNASSAYLSQIGTVSVSGSQTVYGSGTYTLTVYGSNGQQAICATTIQNTYTPVYQQPYVSLTQIPYTGFDFGPIGNAMYWASLVSFAIAGAYLMVYYLPRTTFGKAGRGGALAFATAMVPARKFAPVVAPMAPILVEKQALASAAEVKMQPIVAAMKKAAGTLDTMAIVTAKDGSMPKIVIQRS